MSWAIVAGAVIGGVASYAGAKESNKPKTAKTDQKSESLPYAPTIDHFNKILEEQAGLYAKGPPDYQALAKAAGGGGGSGAKGKAAMDIYGKVADAGLAAGQTPNMQLAERGLASVWGDGATGFEGYNPILAGIAGDLEGSDLSLSRDLLQQYLGTGNSTGAAAGASRAGGGGGGGGGGGSYNFSAGGGGGVVPDTGAGNGTFQRELDRIFSEEANEEEIAAVLDSMRGDLERSKFTAMADLEARAAGTGRSGGSAASADIANANARFAEELGQISAQLRYGDLTERRNARLAAMNMLNNRDVAAMGDATSRAGINASAGAAGASLALQEKLGLRGQDLQAIMGLMEGEKFNLGTLTGIGERLSGDRLGALSLIPGMEGVSAAGRNSALGAAGGMGTLAGIDAAGGRAAADRRFQVGMMEAEAPQRMINDYLRSVGIIGGMGGTQTTQGTNVVPGAGVSTGSAALAGALGGGMAGAGMAGSAGITTGGWGYLGNQPGRG